jgi:hypothetical protein
MKSRCHATSCGQSGKLEKLVAETNSICSVSQLTELVARDVNALDPLPANSTRFPGDTLPPSGSRAQQIEHLLEYVSPPASVQLQTIEKVRNRMRGWVGFVFGSTACPASPIHRKKWHGTSYNFPPSA